MPELVTFRAGVLFTLYLKRGDMWILVPVGYSGADDAAQPGVLVSVQTLGSPETLLSLYSGGDPGLTPSDDNFLINITSGNLTMHVIGKDEGSYTFTAQDEGQNSTLLAQDLQHLKLINVNQLCFQTKLTSKATEIEMCAYNSFAQFPFRLDGKRLERTACTKILFVGSLHLYCCSVAAPYIPGLVRTIYFDDHDLEDLAGNVLLIGLSDYETIVFNEVYQPSYITLPEVLDRDILVVVISSYWLYSATTHAEFSELRWARPTKPCQYQLFSTEGFTNNESALLVFDDNDPFQNQPLTSELYFILVPRGCQPTIAVAPKTSQCFAIYHHCEGSVFATAPGYKTRFHSAIPAYDYNTTWLCDAFQIDITIELLDFVNGDLTLAIRNLTDETVPGGM
ncbi:unnamed protein product, partial [Mesorhabditis spiculigera]